MVMGWGEQLPHTSTPQGLSVSADIHKETQSPGHTLLDHPSLFLSFACLNPGRRAGIGEGQSNTLV